MLCIHELRVDGGVRSVNLEFFDDRFNDLVRNALEDFKKIGWLNLEDDEFDINPAFHRIHKIYGDYINDIENIIKKMSEE